MLWREQFKMRQAAMRIAAATGRGSGMAGTKNPKPGESTTPIPDSDPVHDNGAVLAVEMSEPVILQEPDQKADASNAVEQPIANAEESVQKPAKQSSGLLGFVVGGALLAASGFAAQRYLFPDTETAGAIVALQGQLAEALQSTTKLQADMAVLAADPADIAGLAKRLAAVEAGAETATELSARLTALERRLTEIEAASVTGAGGPAAALATMARELADLKAAMASQTAADPIAAADAKATQAQLLAAEAAAQSAAKLAAFSHLRAAFDSGASLEPALEGLKGIGIDVPAALADGGGNIPSLLTLQDGFAGSARAALDASIRADMGEGWADRLTSFLRSQSGARSLTPREGNDPDAVLSRAESALHDGQIDQTLAELTGLPPVGAEAMAPWIAEATRRLAAEQAIADLSATLNGQ